MAPTPEALRNAFVTLERCAVAGERCPNNGTPGIDSAVTGALARAGKIKVEVSGRNWRTVTILIGPHAGRKTMPDPNGGHIYKTIGRSSTFTPKSPGQMTPWQRRRREISLARRAS